MNIVERDIFPEIEKYMDSPEVLVLTGCRQSGKTTTLRYFFDKLTSSNKLFLDLENILNRRYFEEEDYEAIKAAFELQGIDFSKRPYIFLDEIQYVKNLPSVVKYLKDHYDVKFFLTGSASFYLKNLFSESLAGRKYIIHIYPLTFSEFIRFKGHKIKYSESLPYVVCKHLDSLFSEYISFGGFPAVVLKTTEKEKRNKLQDIFSSYFEMEVEKLRDFAKLKKVRDTLLLLFLRSASLVDISRLAQELEISRITLKEYMDFFEKTFFFDFVKPYSASKDVEIRKRAKVYPVDVGLAKEMGFSESGGLFEIALYQNIKVKHTVNYYRLKNGQEIDFIVDAQDALEAKNFCHPQDVRRLGRLVLNLRRIKDYKMIVYRKPAESVDHVEWAPQFLLKV